MMFISEASVAAPGLDALFSSLAGFAVFLAMGYIANSARTSSIDSAKPNNTFLLFISLNLKTEI
jgi:hypothetical protein